MTDNMEEAIDTVQLLGPEYRLISGLTENLKIHNVFSH